MMGNIGMAGGKTCKRYFTMPGWRVLVLSFVILAHAQPSRGEIWVTGSAMEMDRCAAAWLIKRHVDPAAEFRFIGDNEIPVEGTAFDLPIADLRRDHRRSTYEAILERYDIREERAVWLGELVHDIEINFIRSNNQLARQLETSIRSIIHETQDTQTRLSQCLVHLDTIISMQKESQ